MSVFILMIGQLPFDELTPEEKVRQSAREKRRLAAKAQEEAIEGNTSNKNNLEKVSPKLIGSSKTKTCQAETTLLKLCCFCIFLLDRSYL
jgi:Fic family protein